MDAMEAIDNQEITVSLNAYETAVLMKAISVYCTVSAGRVIRSLMLIGCIRGCTVVSA